MIQKSEVVILSSKEIVKHIRALGIKHLVVAGGEPLIQQTELNNVLLPLKMEGYYIEIETNGTIPPTNSLLSLADQWNVSPKLENSGNPLSAREVNSFVVTFRTSWDYLGDQFSRSVFPQLGNGITAANKAQGQCFYGLSCTSSYGPPSDVIVGGIRLFVVLLPSHVYLLLLNDLGLSSRTRANY